MDGFTLLPLVVVDHLPDVRLLPPPHPACRACVVVPARNEAGLIGTTLDALAGQSTLSGQPLDRKSYEVILLANNCQDGTAQAARQAARRHPGFVVHVLEARLTAPHAHVGFVRRWLMDVACTRLLDTLGQASGIVATTDADTRVDPRWLAATRHEMTAPAVQAQAVSGWILPCPESFADLPPTARAIYLRDLAYRRLADAYEHLLDPLPADPWPRHYHEGGASLAVTAACYRRVGGLPALPAREDVAFCRLLRAHDVRFRHSPRVRVTTSVRCLGRAQHGMADTLLRWGEAAADEAGPLVESPDALARRVRLVRRLRAWWRAWQEQGDATARRHPARFGRLARELGTSPRQLAHTLTAYEHFGALRQRFAALESDPEETVADTAAGVVSFLSRPRQAAQVRPGCALTTQAQAIAGLQARLRSHPHLGAWAAQLTGRSLEQIEAVSRLAPVVAL